VVENLRKGKCESTFVLGAMRTEKRCWVRTEEELVGNEMLEDGSLHLFYLLTQRCQ